ncbi:hypothetical protein D7Z54_17040 [Salibacterium salarium]|uniref:Uncharacterized protein n=1 Tax=Salibacterium salarium TaxID=284579 RepID=A0A428N1J2_9BACI|nr:hypothetical protein D7Z54_17040 [Salibacterium salarium]
MCANSLTLGTTNTHGASTAPSMTKRVQPWAGAEGGAPAGKARVSRPRRQGFSAEEARAVPAESVRLQRMP